MTPPPEFFDDIHIHGLTGPRRLTSISPDTPISTAPAEAWYSAGIHPWDTAAPVSDGTWRALERLAADPRVAAIGECGLDALRGGTPEQQEAIFARQAAIAESAGKFMIIHCVRRYGRLMELKKQLRPTMRWVIHGFRGKPELARQLAAAGFDLSVPAGSPLPALLPAIRFFHETDEPAKQS